MKLSLTLGLISSIATTVISAPQFRSECPNGVVVRPEWSQLSRKHRKEYVSALKCMIDKPSTVEETEVKNHYEDFWYTHQFPGHAIHFVGAFFPWHRHYVWKYHNSLRECGYTGEMPFWAWDWNHDDVFKSSVFDPDTETGLGTNGTKFEGPPLNASIVTDGALANHHVEYPYAHMFERNLSTTPKGIAPLDKFFQPSEMETAFNFTNYEYFHRYVEGAPPQEPLKDIPGYEGEMGFAGMHGAVHRMIGGDMAGIIPHKQLDWCPSFTSDESSNYGANSSPNDPLFFLHHANIDRIWAQWQDTDPENRMYAYGGWTFHNYTTESGEGNATLDDMLKFGFITDEVPVRHAMDYRSSYCYVYADKDYREDDSLMDILIDKFHW